MSVRVLIRAHQSVDYEWIVLDTDSPMDLRSGRGSLAQLQLELGEQRCNLGLLLAGDRVCTRRVSVVAKERRHLRQAIPYLLEETLVGDIEQLHFSYGRWSAATGGVDGMVPVAWCERDWLRQILSTFDEHQLELAYVVPEPLLLFRDQGWLLRMDEHLSCHLANGYGFSVDSEIAAEALALLFQQALLDQQLPDQLVLSASSEAKLAQLKAALPAQLLPIAHCRLESLWQAILPSSQRGAEFDSIVELDLLQGDFVRRLPLGRWWQQWRGAAALLCIALCAWAANSFLGIQQQRGQYDAMQLQIEQAFRRAIPQGVLVDAQKQLRNRLAGLGGSADYQGPVALLAQVAPLIEQDDGILVRGLTYNMRQQDLRLNCRAQSFSAIEKLRGRFVAAGLAAELVHSSADGEGQQARFLISWGQR